MQCPGINNFEYLEINYPAYASSGGSVAFSGGGSTHSGGSIDLCYLGEDRGSGPAFAATIDTAVANCDALLGDGKMLGDYSVLMLDTRVVSEVNFEVGSSDFFDMSCANQTVSRRKRDR